MKLFSHLLLGGVLAALCLFLHFAGGLESKLAFGFWALIQFIASLALLAFDNETRERVTPARLTVHASAPSAQDQERAWQILQRIEDRLSRLESAKTNASTAPSPELAEIKLLQQKTLSEVSVALKAIDGARQLQAAPSYAAETDDKLAELSGALSEAIKEISKRDVSIDVLVANASKANIQRPLIRLTQLLEVTRTLKARVSEGKSAADESFEFLVEDMAAALEDFGVEHLELTPGAKVADLPAGCFAAISVVETEDLALRGTVKEVRSRAFFISEEGKKPRFIAPAKVILYRG
jgi:hypothetical protein